MANASYFILLAFYSFTFHISTEITTSSACTINGTSVETPQNLTVRSSTDIDSTVFLPGQTLEVSCAAWLATNDEVRFLLISSNGIDNISISRDDPQFLSYSKDNVIDSANCTKRTTLTVRLNLTLDLNGWRLACVYIKQGQLPRLCNDTNPLCHVLDPFVIKQGLSQPMDDLFDSQETREFALLGDYESAGNASQEVTTKAPHPPFTDFDRVSRIWLWIAVGIGDLLLALLVYSLLVCLVWQRKAPQPPAIIIQAPSTDMVRHDSVKASLSVNEGAKRESENDMTKKHSIGRIRTESVDVEKAAEKTKKYTEVGLISLPPVRSSVMRISKES